MAVGFSDGVGSCRMLLGWCRVLSGLEVSGRCQGLSGLSVCEDAYALSRAVGAVGAVVLSGFGWCQVVSGCRVCVGKSRVNGAWPSGRAALLCGVRLAPRFDPDNNKQGVEESNPTCIP